MAKVHSQPAVQDVSGSLVVEDGVEKVIAVKLRVVVAGEPTAKGVPLALDRELPFYSGRAVSSGRAGETAVKRPVVPRSSENAHGAVACVD